MAEKILIYCSVDDLGKALQRMLRDLKINQNSREILVVFKDINFEATVKFKVMKHG